MLSYTEKVWAVGLRPLIKQMNFCESWLCRNAFHNGAMAHIWQIHESTIHRIFVACVVFMEAIFPCFNLKPDDSNPATTILIHKLSQLHKNTYTWKGLVGTSQIGMGLMFSKMHAGSISDLEITEKNSMWLAGFRKKNIMGLSSKIFLVSKMFFKKAMSKKIIQFSEAEVEK